MTLHGMSKQALLHNNMTMQYYLNSGKYAEYFSKLLNQKLSPKQFLRIYNTTCQKTDVANLCPCIPEKLGK